MMMMRSFAIVLLATATGCGPTALQRGAKSFADVSSGAVQSISPAFDDMARICHRRSAVQFLHSRIQAPTKEKWVTPPLWTEWEKEHKEGRRTMDEHCRLLAAVDNAHHRSLEAIGEYSRALAALSDAGTYDGSDISDILSSVADATGSASDSASGPASAFASALGEPLKGMVDLVLRQWSSHELKGAIDAASSPLDNLLAALTLYVEAEKAELKLLAEDETELYDTMQRRIADAPSPAAATEFYQLATDLDSERARFTADVDGYAAALTAVRDAHRALSQASGQRKSKEVVAALKRMSGYIATAWVQIGKVRHGKRRSAE